jgi:DNA invertase Pin-like site-specific DNA recombinase
VVDNVNHWVMIVGMSTARTRTVAYLRVSTDKQADTGVSLDAQRAKVAAYADLYDLDVVEVIVDAGASAKSLDRPGLIRALDMLRKGAVEALLVVKLDRLTRSVRDLGELVERFFASGKAALLSVSEQVDTRTASGRMVLNIMATISQWERETIGERTATAMRFKAASGEYIGGEPPFGFGVADDGVRLVPVESEQSVLAIARELRAAGLSLRAVARELDARGLRSRVARPFSASQIRRMTA